MTQGQREERESAALVRAAVLRLADDEGRLPGWAAEVLAECDEALSLDDSVSVHS